MIPFDFSGLFVIQFLRFNEGQCLMPKRFYLFFIAAVILHTICAPNIGEAAAITYEVNPSSSSCLPSANPPCYTTIQSAIDAAVISAQTNTQNSYSVLVEPGTYSGGILLKSNIPVRGRETARTLLSGGGSGTVVTASGMTSVSISNFTIINASTGILVSNSSSVSILNNVFRTGTGGTAVQVQNSTTTSIINNTFHQNGTAISRDADITIKNNILSTNTVAISAPSTPSTLITYNCFFANITDGPTGSNAVTLLDPLFVSTSALDFHLKQVSPCIDAGDSAIQYNDSFDSTRNDIGAYGGPASDTIPFQISGVVSTLVSATTISISWNPNNSYVVSGYRLYYGTASGVYTGTGATEGDSPIDIASGTTTTTLSSLATATIAPPSPTLNSTSPLNGALVLSWTASSGATGYKVYYGTSSPPTTPVDVGNTTTYTLTGLTNGQTYFVAVSAVTQATYFMAVTAFDNSAGPFDPGISHESAYSQEVSENVGAPAESSISNILSDFPEAILPYPDLPNKGGCFIATAAYGYYSAPQVQALREFRDRYLMTNSLGLSFVEWYYQYGPIGADFLNAHSWLKPVTRAALLPAVGGAVFMTQTSMLTKTIVFAVMSVVVIFSFRRKLYGGSR